MGFFRRFFRWLFFSNSARQANPQRRPEVLAPEKQLAPPSRSSNKTERYSRPHNGKRNSQILPPRPKRDDAKAYKKEALPEALVKRRIGGLPQGQVISIVDGDSVILAINRDENMVRLDSMAGLIKMIGGRTVYLELHGQDGYCRTLATVYVQGRKEDEWINVNERMVMLGHAWVMRYHFDHLPPGRQQKLIRLERWARSNRVGLWSQTNPVPPWRWRRESEV
jgi:micrococcal nuclease